MVQIGSDDYDEVDGPLPTPCFVWRRSLDCHGYARFGRAGAMWSGHRVAYEAVHGPIPAGMTIDHLCRNRACVNALHLEVVTRAENVRRGAASKITAADAAAIRRDPRPYREIASEYGISRAQISRIRRGKRWTDGPRVES